MHQQFLSGGCACLLVSTAFLGCGSPEPIAKKPLAVIGGIETGSNHESVVYVAAEIANIGGTPITKAGSGSMVAPNLVVTALHVISRNPSNVPFTCDATGNDVSGSQGSQLGATVAPEKIAVYAGPLPDGEPLAYGKQLVTSGSTTICQNDIAFVVLDRDLDLPAIGIHRGAPAHVGDVLTAVGFGGEDTTRLNPRTQREVNVTAVGQWIRTFTVSEGPCEGDSGGPGLSEAGALAGIFSSVSMDCTNENASAKYTDVSFFSPLVEAAFDAAGAGSPWTDFNGGAAGAFSTDPTTAGTESAAGDGGAPSVGGSTESDGSSDDTGCTLQPRHAQTRSTWWLGLLASVLSLAARRPARR
jgi:hypothetical protein